MVKADERPFKRGEFWFRVFQSDVFKDVKENVFIYTAYAKREPFVFAEPEILLEPGDLWFDYGDTWSRAFSNLEASLIND